MAWMSYSRPSHCTRLCAGVLLQASVDPQDVMNGGNWLVQVQNQNLNGAALDQASSKVGFTPVVQIALGVPCWPGNMANRGRCGMLTFGLLAMLYLTCVGVIGVAGILLWPAVAVHVCRFFSFGRCGRNDSHWRQIRKDLY